MLFNRRTGGQCYPAARRASDQRFGTRSGKLAVFPASYARDAVQHRHRERIQRADRSRSTRARPAIRDARSHDARVAAAVAPPTPQGDPAWQKYVGVYTWEDEEIHVAVLDGKLTIVDPSEDNPWESRIPLEPVSGHVFRMADGFAEGETVTFILDAAGKVTRYEAPGYYMSRRP